MRQRLPMIFSVTALVVAVLGSTPLGHAALNVVAPGSRDGPVEGQFRDRVKACERGGDGREAAR